MMSRRKFYTADPHFGHTNIMRFCNRPFSSVEEMDATLIANWRRVVRPDDEVYLLGDFSFKGNKHPQAYLDQLPGQIHFIWGNHDPDRVRQLSGWASSQPYLEIRDGEDDITLLHYAMRVWNKSHFGALHFFGHTHAQLPGNDQSVDVGVDYPAWNFTPVDLETIKAHLATLPAYEGRIRKD